MEKYTELEIKILTILAKNHGSEWSTDNGETAHNDTWEMTTDGTKECGTIFSSYDLDPKVYRGVIASLIKKGAVDMDEYETNCPKNIYNSVPMIAIAISEKAFNKIKVR
tara:strand:- start:10415 stop:10741 length:327 start_codon:yes stop_codon:yes gene_type:complete